MNISNEIPQIVRKDILLRGATTGAFRKDNLVKIVQRLNHETREMLVDFIMSNENSLDGYSADLQDLISKFMTDLVALEVVLTLLLKTKKRTVATLAEDAANMLTEDVDKEVVAQLIMQNRVMAEFAEENGYYDEENGYCDEDRDETPLPRI